MVSLVHMLQAILITWHGFQGQIIKDICEVFIFFYSRDQSCASHLKSFLPMWQDWFCLGLACDLQLMMESLMSNHNLTACWFSLVTPQQHWITCCIQMAAWREPASEIFGAASSPVLVPLEQSTQTLYIISFLQECYPVNQCRLLVTEFPFNFINNSFFCCLGSLVRQTKMQCCQVCWEPTVMLAEHFALF